MASRKTWILGVAVGLGVAGLGGVGVWRGWEEWRGGAAVAAGLPERPEAGRLGEGLAERVAAAEEAARGGRGKARWEGVAGLSRLYHANGYFGEAEACYRLLAGREPGEAVWWHRWGSIVAGSGYLEEALPLLEAVVRLAPEYGPGWIRRGEALLKLGRLEEAERVFGEALGRFPGNPYALVGKARARVAADDWKGALPLLEEAARGSQFRIGTDLLATAYRNLGREEAADNLLRETSFGGFVDIEDPWMEALMEDCWDPYRLASAGGMAEFRGRREEGLRLLERAVGLDGEKALYHFQLARMAHDLGRLDQAEKHYREAIARQADLADPYVYLIALLDQRRRPEEAQQVLFRGYKNCPNSPSMHMEMAKYLLAQGIRGRAMIELETAARLRPQEAGAWLLKARIHFEADEVAEGVEAMERALGAEPGNELALSTLALHAIKVGDRERADGYMRRVYNQPKMKEVIVADLEKEYRVAFGRDY